MSRFLSDLNIELLPRKPGYWRVAKPLLFLDKQGRTWEVPAGTETDGASIPRFFWRVVGHPLDWKFADAATLHDYLYESQLVTRRAADDLFREALLARGVSAWLRWSMWAAVRIFGRWSWNRTVWAVILAVALIAMACGCRSITTEIRDGKPWVVEEVTAWPFTLSHKEYPKPTPKEQEAEDKRELENTWASRGMWLVAIGGLVSCCGIALALYSQVKLVDKIAILASCFGAAAAVWGLILVGVAWHLSLLVWPLVVIATVFLVAKVRKRSCVKPS